MQHNPDTPDFFRLEAEAAELERQLQLVRRRLRDLQLETAAAELDLTSARAAAAPPEAAPHGAPVTEPPLSTVTAATVPPAVHTAPEVKEESHTDALARIQESAAEYRDSLREKLGGAKADESTAEERETAEFAIGRTWLNRLGAIILFLGIAFFVKYSFDQGWISPAMRVIAAGAVGLALIGAGQLCLRRAMRPVAAGLMGAGVGVLYVAAFAAYNFYHLVGPTVGFTLYCGVSAISVALAIYANLQGLAVIGLIGGFCTPIALSTGSNQQVALLTYVLLLDLAFVAVAVGRRWDVLHALSWLGTALLFGGWGIKFYDESVLWRTWGFLLAFYLILHTGIVVQAAGMRFRIPQLLAALVYAGNAAFVFFTWWLLREEAEGFLGLFAVITGGTQWLIAWRLIPTANAARPISIAFWIGGAAILALAVPLQFDRYLVVVSWTIQAAATLAFCRRFEEMWLRVKGLAVWVAAFIHLILIERTDAALQEIIWQSGVLFIHYYVLLGLLCAAGAFAGAALLVAGRSASRDDRGLSVIFAVAGSALFLWITADAYDRYVAAVCWWVLATAFWAVSLLAPGLRPFAFALTAASAGKHFIWDTLGAPVQLWRELETPGINRAVFSGIVASAVCAFGKLVDLRRPGPWRFTVLPISPADLLTWLGLTCFLWIATFEIVRVFTVDMDVRSWVTNPAVSGVTGVSYLWAASALMLWIVARGHWRNVLYFALTLAWLLAAKFVIIDTLFLFANNNWNNIRGPFANPVVLAGCACLAVVGLAYARVRRLDGSDQRLFRSAELMQAMLIALAALITWIPSFEIVRIFKFEPLRLQFADPRLAMHLCLSVLWAVIATGLLIVGFARRVAVLRYSALALYVFTVIKVFLVDMAALETVYRIISFVVLGVLLLFASVLYQRLSPRIMAQPRV